jgi:hypothetical protein
MSHPNLRAARAVRSLAIAVAALSLAGCQSGQEKDKEKDWFDGGPMQLASPDTMQLTARVLAAKGKTEQAGFLIERMYQKYPACTIYMYMASRLHSVYKTLSLSLSSLLVFLFTAILCFLFKSALFVWLWLCACATQSNQAAYLHLKNLKCRLLLFFKNKWKTFF